MSSNVPIDIHCSKLVEWLIQRRHCKKDWGENLANIRRKIKMALKDMPEDKNIKDILIQSKLDYFKCKEIVEVLKTTEADSKNFLGFYSSQRMKDWQDIVKSYEKDCIYLTEMATDLIRDLNYEIPGIKRLITKLKQDKDDAEKKRSNLLRRAQQSTSEHQKLAQSYGITGNDIYQELKDKLKTLNSLMDQVVNSASNLGDELKLYQETSSLTTKRPITEILPTLKYVIDHGNTTVYEWKYGEIPVAIEAPELIDHSNNQESTSDINMYDDDDDDEIDFGDELASSESSSGFIHVEKSSDFENLTKNQSEESFLKVDKIEQTSDKVARGNDARLLLELRSTRNQFLNNLYELDAFIKQSINNLNQSEDRSNIGSNLLRFDLDQLKFAVLKIMKIIEIFNAESNHILFQVIDSPIFIKNLEEKLLGKIRASSECKTLADEISNSILDIENQIEETERHLRESVIVSKKSQERLQNCLRSMYGGRPVNIMS